MTRRIKGQVKVWLTGGDRWDIEKLTNSECVGDFTFASLNQDMSEYGWIEVGTAEIDMLLITDRTAIVTAQVDVLKQQAQKIRAEAALKVGEIENEIKNLLAITYEQPTPESSK